MRTKQLTFMIPVLLIASMVQAADIPALPAPRDHQFAVELFKIETPNPFNKKAFSQDLASIEELFKSDKNRVFAQPVLYAAVGSMVESDQTEEVMLPEDFNVVSGSIVPINKRQHLGVRTRVKLLAATSTTATFHIDFHHQVLKGYDTHKLGNGTEVELPIFEVRKVNTDVTQRLDSWVVVGGIESTKEGQTSTAYYIIRISRP